MVVAKVTKRDGRVVEFDATKIASAIRKALIGVYDSEISEKAAEKRAKEYANTVVRQLNKTRNGQLQVEEIQDVVEQTLMDKDKAVAKAYILYRKKHAEMRTYKESLGINDDLKMPLNSLVVLAMRYLQKDDAGHVIETPKQMFRRVAHAIASVDLRYNISKEKVDKLEEEFFAVMTSFDFMPNSPTLMNAGTNLGQLSACFVLPVADSMEGIFDAVKWAAMIHKSGGGCGFDFSLLRPAGDIVKATKGIASGPVSFMKIFDAETEQIKQGGKRRGANMAILRVDHPDILSFIVLKEKEEVMRNFNISVAITDSFIKALEKDADYELVNPRTKAVVGKLNSRAVWNLIVMMAWRTGDPGLVFIDRVNASTSNPTPSFGPITSTNPCGESPLYAFDSCNLASINLANVLKMSKGGYDVDWEKLKRLTHLAVRFLDNVIDANKYPLPQIEKVTRAIRRIGLGVMGWADMLIMLGIRYDSDDAVALADKVMGFINKEGKMASEKLAEEKGAFPEFEKSIWKSMGKKPLRNSNVTTIAPTGTISIIAGETSPGIEPIFSVVYMRNLQSTLGANLVEVNKVFEETAIKEGFYSDELMKKLAGRVSIQGVDEVPKKVKQLYVTAYDIDPQWHVKMQAVFQKHTDNAVSKTINMPNAATPQDVDAAYMLAYKTGCRGITIYRDRSKSAQVLTAAEQAVEPEKRGPSAKGTAVKASKLVEGLRKETWRYNLEEQQDMICPECGSLMVAAEGCRLCPRCGYSACLV